MPAVGEDRLIQWTDSIAIAKKGKVLGSISASYPVGYIVDNLPINPVIISGAPLATVEYLSEYQKVYSEMSEDEIHEHNRFVEESFSAFLFKVCRD